MKELLTKKLQLPSDVISGDMLVTLTENREAIIENYKGLIAYQSDSIVVKGKHSTLNVKGKNLHIKYFTNDDMQVEGRIEYIQYIN